MRPTSTSTVEEVSPMKKMMMIMNRHHQNLQVQNQVVQ
jgi:hypothetical protein